MEAGVTIPAIKEGICSDGRAGGRRNTGLGIIAMSEASDSKEQPRAVELHSSSDIFHYPGRAMSSPDRDSQSQEAYSISYDEHPEEEKFRFPTCPRLPTLILLDFDASHV